MRTILLFILFPFLGITQQTTYVPDDNFEQALINLGFDAPPLDDYVYTSMINNIPSLFIGYGYIADLTGIEDFTNIVTLECQYNQLTSLDVSNNAFLTYINCQSNQLTSLILNNPLLSTIECNDNQLTSLDFSSEIVLDHLSCGLNQLTSLVFCPSVRTIMCELNLLTSLDVSNNEILNIICSYNLITSLDFGNSTLFQYLDCSNNQLTSLNLKNSNNQFVWNIDATGNPNLSCFQVDDEVFSFVNWSNGPNNNSFYFDPIVSFSADCNYPNGVLAQQPNGKKYIKIVDGLGKEILSKKIHLYFIFMMMAQWRKK